MSVITIKPDGTLAFIYEDRLRLLLDLGAADVRRASHVEPTGDARWTADLRPVGGPVLGPFELHSEALAAERAWIEAHVLRFAPSADPRE
jgi:hypothetical protein